MRRIGCSTRHGCLEACGQAGRARQNIPQTALQDAVDPLYALKDGGIVILFITIRRSLLVWALRPWSAMTQR